MTVPRCSSPQAITNQTIVHTEYQTDSQTQTHLLQHAVQGHVGRLELAAVWQRGSSHKRVAQLKAALPIQVLGDDLRVCGSDEGVCCKPLLSATNAASLHDTCNTRPPHPHLVEQGPVKAQVFETPADVGLHVERALQRLSRVLGAAGVAQEEQAVVCVCALDSCTAWWLPHANLQHASTRTPTHCTHLAELVDAAVQLARGAAHLLLEPRRRHLRLQLRERCCTPCATSCCCGGVASALCQGDEAVQAVCHSQGGAPLLLRHLARLVQRGLQRGGGGHGCCRLL